MTRNRIRFEQHDDYEVVTGTCVHTFPAHIHKRLCVGVILEGKAHFTLNEHTAVLGAGDLFIVPAYTPHSLTAVAPDAPFGYRTFCFRQTPCPAEAGSFVNEALQLIEDSGAGITLGELADAVHVSKYHLDRRFKSQIGIAPHQFFQWSRIKKVRQGLLEGAPLPDLAYSLGFADESHLCNVFKRYLGITPLQYAASYTDFREARG